MKRHHQRQAQQLLTLSLMGSLALLAACGGGGKGGAPVAAAPAAVEVHEPSILEVADPNEPYILSESYSETQGDGNKYQLNLIDGITQKPLASLSFPTSTAGMWVTVNRIERTPIGTDSFAMNEVDKGPSMLYYVRGGKVYQFDLSRTSKNVQDLNGTQISAITNACAIASSYNLKQDGSKSALIVKTVGTDGKCGSPKVVETDDATNAPVRSAVDANVYKPLAYLYEAGALTGILAQHTIDATTAQLDVLAPSGDSALVEGVPISNGGSTTFQHYTIDSTKTDEVGVEWISRAPRSYANGYLRIQGSEIINILAEGASTPTPTLTPFNRFYQFNWNGVTKVASVNLFNTIALTPGVKSNIGLTDDKYVYFANGSTLSFGPVEGSAYPFRTKSLEFTNFPEKIVKLYQTAKYVVVVQQGITGTQVRGIDKQTGAVNVLVSGGPVQKLKILGLQGDSLVYTMAVDTDNSGIHLNSVPLTPSGDFGFATSTQLLQGVFVQSIVTDNALTYGEKNLSRLVTCKPASLISTNCLNATLKVYDLVSKQITKELGALKIEDSTNITLDAPPALVGNTNVFRVKKILPDGVTNSMTPWLFHSGVKGSLKELDTFPPATPASGASAAN